MPVDHEKLLRSRALRSALLSNITSLHIFSLDIKDVPQNFAAFKVRRRSLERWKNLFEKHHSDIISLVCLQDNAEDALVAEQEIYDTYLEKCQFIDTTYYELFELPDEINLIQNASERNNSENTHRVKLPKINLIHFHGDIKKFPNFIGMFSSLVHDNVHLTNIEKFNYLLSVLKGAPLALVKCTPLLDENYLSAYKSLNDRYCNERLLANAYWKEIDNFRPIPNDGSLRKLLDVFNENLSALETLGFPINQWSFILMHMLLDRLDQTTLKLFELEYASNKVPTYDEVRNILLKHCTAVESIALNTKPYKKISSFKNSIFEKNISNERTSFLVNTNKYSIKNSDTTSNTKNLYCFLCKGKHIIYQCAEFLSKSAKDRYQIVKKFNACVNCLANSHSFSKCSSNKRCKICGKSHHSLLHFTEPKNDQIESIAIPSTSTSASDSEIKSFNGLLSKNNALSLNQVLLSIVKFYILNSCGQSCIARGVLDSGSQISFISEKLAPKLNLKKFNISVHINDLDKMTTSAKFGVSCELISIYDEHETYKLDAVIVDKICDKMPSYSFSLKKLEQFSNLKFADPELNIPGEIDVLLGADVFPYILRDGRIVNSVNEPGAVNTIFGWTLLGKTPLQVSQGINSFISIVSDENNINLDSALRQFWSIEEVPSFDLISPEDKFCENYFQNTTYRTPEGRYVVSLPFKLTCPNFGDSRLLALRRFHSFERKLLKSDSVYQTYSNIFRDYLEQGHIELAPSYPPECSNDVFYLPHSCVFRKDSSTTPVRIVFDGSSRFPDKISLNDALHTGPKLQRDLIKISLNFRIHRFVFCTDICQMYRMILVNSEHQDFLRILWRFSSDETIKEYRLKILPFGLVCSPYLAIRTLEQLAQDYDDLPLARDTILNNAYVDDLVDGDDSLENTISKVEQLVYLLNRGGFQLKKWCSNDQAILKNISPQFILHSLSFDPKDELYLKVLGLQWNPLSDNFSYNTLTSSSECTKRTILSNIARIYDPLGYLAPCIILLKILIQNLWTIGVDWDTLPPEEIITKFKRFQAEMTSFSELKIPRYYENIRSEVCEIHGFGDASELGYCSVVYLRILYKNDEFKTFFVCAKSKVSPLKKISLPRLELSAAVLLSKLVKFISDTYKDKLNITNIFGWSDSTVTLSWIRSSPHRWKTFVGNRVSYIQDVISPDRWFYVPSEINPADLGTRGLFPCDLLNCKEWFEGPQSLKNNKHSWKHLLEPNTRNEDISMEANKTCFTMTSTITHCLDELLVKFSSLTKILRVLCYIYRFTEALRNRRIVGSVSNSITCIELHRALLCLVKRVQEVELKVELAHVSNGDKVPKYLRKLNPFIDEKGILRVGGRLAYDQYHYDKKFPILLPSRSKFTIDLITYVHVNLLHTGVNATHFHLGQMFWIFSAKKNIRSVLSKCLYCFKTDPINLQPPMGNLPKLRISQVKAFINVGVDLGGPFDITMSRVRGAKILKAYLALFVCFSTKAIHLELLSDLSSESFLMGFRRFISRRGKCANVFSDCGKNFIASAKYLKKIKVEAAEKESIAWHFNPPSAPHMGGLWEAGIKSTKTHLVQIIGQQILTYEELNTVFIQIEAVLNSRPLCAVSADPNDLTALTPGHFLTLQPMTALPDPDMTQITLNRVSRWQLILKIHCEFWKRWSSEYLHSLHQKSKWNDPIQPVPIGSLVLIKNELLPPLQWKLARITQLNPGGDGVSRVATLKTKSGVIERPLVKLCLLPSY